jgi:hypothetical protein
VTIIEAVYQYRNRRASTKTIHHCITQGRASVHQCLLSISASQIDKANNANTLDLNNAKYPSVHHKTMLTMQAKRFGASHINKEELAFRKKKTRKSQSITYGQGRASMHHRFTHRQGRARVASTQAISRLEPSTQSQIQQAASTQAIRTNRRSRGGKDKGGRSRGAYLACQQGGRNSSERDVERGAVGDGGEAAGDGGQTE